MVGSGDSGDGSFPWNITHVCKIIYFSKILIIVEISALILSFGDHILMNFFTCNSSLHSLQYSHTIVELLSRCTRNIIVQFN